MRNVDIEAGKELENSSREKLLKNQKVRKKRDIGAILYLASELLSLVAASGFVLYNVLKVPISNAIQENKLRREYNVILAQYGDTNGDGFVDKEENREFYNGILYQNQAKYNPNGLPIKDGKEISVEEFTRWVENYKPFIDAQ